MATTLSSVRFLTTILVPSFATPCLLTSLSHLRPHLRLQLRLMLFGVRVKVDPMRKSVSMTILSQYEQPQCQDSSNVADVACGGGGYASADEAVHPQSSGSRERKRGIPWTEDEHKLFLLGLQRVGKGDWKGISRNFVKPRTPTPVARHAQNYFLRRSNLNRRRRRSSLFDITTELVTAIPMVLFLLPVQIENPMEKLTLGQWILP
ncbi:unnamed protein product [Camellia sinensis]